MHRVNDPRSPLPAGRVELHRHKVGKFTLVWCSVWGAAVECSWSSQPRKLSRSEMKQYRAGRDVAMAKLSEMIGGPVLLVEA